MAEVETAEDLIYDFNYNLFLAKTSLPFLRKAEDRGLACRWLHKLSLCNHSINEMKLRNDFMYFLVINIQNGELKEPFNQNPPQGSLPPLSKSVPGTSKEGEEGADATPPKKPIIYENSPDGGAFLASQPIPRSGAFCYLAVVAKSQQD